MVRGQTLEERTASAGSCRSCHEREVAAYASISMSRAFTTPGAGNVLSDFTRNNTFFHARSGFRYAMTRRGDDYYVRQWRENSSGRPYASEERRIDFVIGSGRHAQSYLSRGPAGTLLLLPVTWYTQEGRWGMSPGYDAEQHFGMRRRADFSCLHCHTSYPDLPERPARGDTVSFGAVIREGIGCERCHGRGEEHVRRARAGDSSARDAIVHPLRLPPNRQLDVCLNCHLEPYARPVAGLTTRFGARAFSFEPGNRLSDHLIFFEYPEGASPLGGIEIAHQGYRFLQSACFRKSGGRLTCSACHRVHATKADAAVRRRDACISCHARAQLEKLPSHALDSDCAACHMPQARARDAVHVLVTDHKIQRPLRDAAAQELSIEEDHRGPAEYAGDLRLLFPYDELSEEERAVYLGMAYLGFPRLLERAGRLLATNLSKLHSAPVEAWTSLGWANAQIGRTTEARRAIAQALARDPDFAEARLYQGNLLGLEGKLEAAVAEWKKAVDARPNYPEALANLARGYRALGLRSKADEALKRLAVLDPAAAAEIRLDAKR